MLYTLAQLATIAVLLLSALVVLTVLRNAFLGEPKVPPPSRPASTQLPKSDTHYHT